MAKQVQFRRGTTVEHNTFTGEDGELSVDSTKDTLVVHDNTTVGGHPLAREDMSNVSNTVGASQLNITNSPGQAGQVIQTNGAGVLSFVSFPGSANETVGGDLTGTIANAQINSNTININELNVPDGTAGSVLTTNGSGTLIFKNPSTEIEVGGDLTGFLGNLQLSVGVVGQTELATDSISTIKIVDANVTDAKIDTVSASKLTGALPAIDGSALTNINADGLPYDISFIAGFDTATLPVDVVVQIYGEMVMARTGSFDGEVGFVSTVSAGQPIICDVEKNGTSIYSSKPAFASGASTLTAGTLTTNSFVSGDRITFKVIQIGNTTAGRGLRFMLKTRV